MYFCMSRSFWLIPDPLSVSGLHGRVAQVVGQHPGQIVFEIGAISKKQDSCHLKVLFADCNLKMLLLIYFKLVKVEPSTSLICPGPVSQISCCIHLAFHPSCRHGKY